MAAYPPPYAPPPPGSSRRDQARILKEQTRAARENSRAQQRFFREQARLQRRRSILGPLLILAIGILLLLGRLGHLRLDAVLAWYGCWWPLLFVGAGLILLAEWLWDERAATSAAAAGTVAYTRRGIGGGAIFLLILLAAIGSVLRSSTLDGISTVRSFFNNNESFSEFLGERHEQDDSLDLDLPASTSLVVDNPRGDVNLTGTSSDGRVHVTMHKRVFSDSDSEATRKFHALAPTSEILGGAMRLSVPSLEGGTEDLTISVPAGVDTSISANQGEVQVADLHGPLHVTANHGDIEVSSVSGPVNVRLNGRRSSLSAHDLKGNLLLEGTGQDVTLTDLSGSVGIEGDFYGDTHLENLAGPVRFHTSRTSVSFSSLKGSFDISPHAELTGSGINGPIKLETHSRNISLEDITGDITVSNRNGTVALGPLLPIGRIAVANENGAVTLNLPSRSGGSLHAETRDGQIEDQFAPQAAKNEDLTVLDGKLGEGTGHIDLRTSNADIHIEKVEKP